MKKTILITGAGSGMGKDTAFTLSRSGHTIIATTETEAQRLLLETEAKAAGVRLEIRRLNITNAKDQAIVNEYDIDVLINVAGSGETGPLSEISMERVRETFETNVFGTLAITQRALKGMMARKRGTVVTVSSVAGRIPTAFLAPYSMTKFALSAGMAAMREEIHQVAPEVHISLIEPGAYATGFNQRMFATKYERHGEDSYFYKLIPKLRKEEQLFEKIEQKSTRSIVKKIIEAALADKPKLRYVAPRYQGIYVRILRILGK